MSIRVGRICSGVAQAARFVDAQVASAPEPVRPVSYDASYGLRPLRFENGRQSDER